MCGTANVFILNNWTDLLSAIPSAADREAGYVTRSKVQLRTTQLDACVGFRDNLVLQIEIRNIGEADIPAGSVIRVSAKPCYQEDARRINTTIPAIEGSHTVTMKLVPCGIASVDTLPDTITITITHPTSRLPFKTESAGVVTELCMHALLLCEGDRINRQHANDRVFYARVYL